MNDTQIPQETYTVKDVQQALRISRGTVYNLRQDPANDFPQPLPLGVKGLRFDKDEIEAYRKFGRKWRIKRALG